MMTDQEKNDPYYKLLGVTYIGLQERRGDYPLDMFTDLSTGSSFLRLPGESLETALTRIRQPFKKIS